MSEKTLECRENVGNQKHKKEEPFRNKTQNTVHSKKQATTIQQIEQPNKTSTQTNKPSPFQRNDLHRI